MELGRMRLSSEATAWCRGAVKRWQWRSNKHGWGLPEIGIPQNRWFIMENPIEMDDDWGYPYFRKPPF